MPAGSRNDERRSGLLHRLPARASTRNCSGSCPRTAIACSDRWPTPFTRHRSAFAPCSSSCARSCAEEHRRARSVRPPQSSSFMPPRSSSTTSRRWTTRRSGGVDRRITWHSAKRLRSSPRSGCSNSSYSVLARSIRAVTRVAHSRRPCPTRVGLDGLIGGQAADLLATDRQISFETLEQIHRGKTGALFVASAAAGALTAGAGPDQQQWLAAFAKNLGLALPDHRRLARRRGRPRRNRQSVREDARKTTFVSFSGVAGARQLASELCETADRALRPSGGGPTGSGSCRRSWRRGRRSTVDGYHDDRDKAPDLRGRRPSAAAPLARLSGRRRRSLRAGAGARRTRSVRHRTAREPADRHSGRTAARTRGGGGRRRCSCLASSPAFATVS